MNPGLDLCCTDPTSHLITAGQDLDFLDRDLSDLSVRRVDPFSTAKKKNGCPILILSSLFPRMELPSKKALLHGLFRGKASEPVLGTNHHDDL